VRIQAIGHHAVLCKGCQKARELAQRRELYSRHKPKRAMTRGEIFVIYDPKDLSDGGYGVGAIFDAENHKCNLQAMNYYPGLRYKNYYGKVFEIVDIKGSLKERPCQSA
jgi:hypothetical protein